MPQNWWNKISDFVNTPLLKTPELYDFLDANQDKLTADQVLKIVLPVGLENGWILEKDGVKIGNDLPYLVKDNKTDQIIWVTNFGFLMNDGEAVDKRHNWIIGSIIVSDETGEVLEIRK